MNDLYIHQLETENKQLREQLQLCRNAINEIKEELNKTIDAKDKIIKEQVLEITRLKGQIDEKIKKRIDIAIRLLIKLFGTDDYEINYIIGILNGQRQIDFDLGNKE